ncbi:hypothetical protein HERIO_811 [Hepatospora eriocheir]|uniref:L-type lectin-like domain-containing protein n=1 Tax=Hepatospora eriocheir TaxID=1081669 RepID=A0A1X0QBY2_9MICR|nr:hypothetical protein HERIO_811 [Hepatospora eriocheir]
MLFPTILGILNSKLLASKQEGVFETPLDNIMYKPLVYNDHASVINTVIKKDKLYMRSFADESSLIRWDTKNEVDNWSFSVTFDEPNLSAVEYGGIYIYYTDETPMLGKFHGAFDTFNGYVMGLETKGVSHDLIFGHNKGVSMINMDDYMTKRDSIDPERFRGHSELTMKVIATEKNFKIEIYGDGELIYDSFKLTLNELDVHKKGKYFGIVADYNNVSTAKAYAIKEVKLFSRNETSDYDKSKINQKELKRPEYRYLHQYEHKDEEVNELLHVLTLIQNFVKNAVGDLPNTTIQVAKNEITHQFEIISDYIDKVKQLNIFNQEPDKNLNGKVTEIESQVNSIKKMLESFELSIDKNLKNKTSTSPKTQYILLSIGIISILIYGYIELMQK